jgi:hypothetical protein
MFMKNLYKKPLCPLINRLCNTIEFRVDNLLLTDLYKSNTIDEEWREEKKNSIYYSSL